VGPAPTAFALAPPAPDPVGPDPVGPAPTAFVLAPPAPDPAGPDPVGPGPTAFVPLEEVEPPAPMHVGGGRGWLVGGEEQHSSMQLISPKSQPFEQALSQLQEKLVFCATHC